MECLWAKLRWAFKTRSGLPPVPRHLSVLFWAMNLAMIIALKDSYLTQRPGKDNRTRGRNGEVKQMMNDIRSHWKDLFKPPSDLSDWAIWIIIRWIASLENRKMLFDYIVKSRKSSGSKQGSGERQTLSSLSQPGQRACMTTGKFP